MKHPMQPIAGKAYYHSSDLTAGERAQVKTAAESHAETEEQIIARLEAENEQLRRFRDSVLGEPVIGEAEAA
jgi:hypothetical protein